MAMNVTPFVGTDNFNMETFNNMISQINSGVNGEISDVLAQLGTKAKIQTGSYVGTGTYGADNPCSLTFDFVPKLLYVWCTGWQVAPSMYSGTGTISTSVQHWFLWSSPMDTLYAYNGVGDYKNLSFILNGNTLQFYSDSTANFNRSGYTYNYTMIG